MKRIVQTMAVVVATTMAITMVPAKTQVNAKSKKAVKAKAVCSLKKGTLTISGKGAVPKTKKFRNNSKIKKVVVKKGVTSIPYKTFYKCKNLAEVKFSSTVKNIGIESFYGTKISKVTIPNNVKTIGQGAFGGNKNLKTIKIPGTIKVTKKNGCSGIESITYGSAPEKVYFGEPFKLNTVSYVNGKNYIVSGKNKKYVTKNGMIFTKDEKTLVRVPSETEELNIPQGCEKFALQSIMYGIGEGDEDIYPRCKKLEKIVIPETVKSIDTSSYKGKDYAKSFEKKKEVIIENKNLDSKSVISLCNLSNTASLEKVAPQVNCINIKDGMYITNDNIMLAFTMKDNILNIPEGVKRVESNIIVLPEKIRAQRSLYEIVFPDTVTEIGEKAFTYYDNLQKVVLSKNLKTIGDYAFYHCGIRTIVMPSPIEKVGKDVFGETPIEKVINAK